MVEFKDLKNIKWNGDILIGNYLLENKNNLHYHRFDLYTVIKNKQLYELIKCSYFDKLSKGFKLKCYNTLNRCISNSIKNGIDKNVYFSKHNKYDKYSIHNEIIKLMNKETTVLSHLEQCGVININIGKQIDNPFGYNKINISSSWKFTQEFKVKLLHLGLNKKDVIPDYSHGNLGGLLYVRHKNYKTNERIDITYNDLDRKSKAKFITKLDKMKKLQRKLNFMAVNYTILYKDDKGKFHNYYRGKDGQVWLLNTGFFVKRIFSLNTYKYGSSACDFNLHGRYYNGITNISSKIRNNNLYIMDNKTKEVEMLLEYDFTSCFVNVAYHMLGKKMKDTHYSESAYEIEWIHKYSVGLPKEYRPKIKKIVKRIFVIMFNTDRRENIWEIVRNEDFYGQTFEEYSEGMGQKEVEDCIDCILKEHAPIAELYLNKSGLTLMYKESEIARKVYEFFTSKGIPVIGIHDSFLAPAKHKAQLKDYMLKELGIYNSGGD